MRKATIDAIIAEECRKAQLKELQALLDEDGGCICQLADTTVCDHNWSLCGVIKDRIAELSTPNTEETK